MIRVDERPNWDNIFEKMRFKDEDILRFVKIIIDGMVARIQNQTTSTGEALDVNSQSWLATKDNLGKSQLSLQFTGGLGVDTTYQFVITDTGAQITLIPSYREIHLDLIELSERIGKNYKDWFGIHEDDIDNIMEAGSEIIKERLRE